MKDNIFDILFQQCFIFIKTKYQNARTITTQVTSSGEIEYASLIYTNHIFLIKKIILIYISAISSGDSVKALSSHCSINPKKAEVANDEM